MFFHKLASNYKAEVLLLHLPVFVSVVDKPVVKRLKVFKGQKQVFSLSCPKNNTEHFVMKLRWGSWLKWAFERPGLMDALAAEVL